MRQPVHPATALADRLCRQQRIGVFGHRGVGKTTLLTVIYQQAVSGRLPEFRLAAADQFTANYLSDKIEQLQTGQPLPATLAETDLRFNLHHYGQGRLELLVKDYQGEHVELGRTEPVNEFLRDCDAVWLCLDAAVLSSPMDRLHRQQEVEQLVERYLAAESSSRSQRPTALVLTKADLLPEGTDLKALTSELLAMVRHALESHFPNSGVFAVSSLQLQPATDGGPPRVKVEPLNLEQPLAWLVAALQAQDEARMEQLWSLAGNQLGLLQRCVNCFARRYPRSARVNEYRSRLRQQTRRQTLRRALVAASTVAALFLGVLLYDGLAFRSALRFQEQHTDEPERALENWKSYRFWHPTRNVFSAAAVEAESDRLRDLGHQVRVKERDEQLGELRRRTANPDSDAEKLWSEFLEFQGRFPEMDLEGDLQHLRYQLKARRDDQLGGRAQKAYDDLVASERRIDDLATLLAQTDRFLYDFAGTAHETDVRRRRDAYLTRLDDRDIEFARNYSAKQPLNFQTRREAYQRYLDKHPAGTFAEEAKKAVREIDEAWDKHDFRAVRDHFLAKPADIAELVARCRTYLGVHPRGRFVESAKELLRWSEKVTAPNEYKVKAVNSDFDHSVAYFFSRGPDLSLELEVAGNRYGPTPKMPNRYDPDWDYEFPRPIRWKLGDPVRILVTDHDWKKRIVLDVSSAEGDPLAIRLLTGQVLSGKHKITFESDFALPRLPEIE